MIEPNAEQLQNMKALETAMLASFVEVCRKLSLRYYLVGGTLLGAVRHGGFIPWDDDIDVAMPREDYEIFLREGQALLPEYYFIQTLDTDPGYRANYAKLRDCRTTFVEYSVRKLPMNHGLFIDVFPLDNYPDGEEAQKKMNLYQRLIKLRGRTQVEVPAPARHGWPVELGLNTLSHLLRLRWPDYRKALRQRETIQTSVKPGEKWANYSGAWGMKEIMPACWYGAGTPVCFEGLTVMAPEQYDKWLRNVYGDYMQLPPVEKRVGHHYAQVIDLETPCAQYLKTIGKANP